MNKILPLLATLTLPLSAWAGVSVASPDGKVVMKIDTNAQGHLDYEVTFNGHEVVSPSPLGVTVDGKDLGDQAALGTETKSENNATYPVLGVHSTATDHDNEDAISITGGAGKTAWMLEVRVFNDGAAYRYRVPGAGDRTLIGESTSWVLPPDAAIWFQNDLSSYEGQYTQTTVGALNPDTVVAFPATLRLPDGAGYASITEANLVHYSDLVTKAGADHALHAYFYANQQGWPTHGEILSPWRVTIVSADLNGLVNSDIVHNLCPPPPPELATADWIVPGRCTWQWWSSDGPKLEEQHQYVDWTRQLGFEYYLIDEGWEDWKPSGGKTKWDAIKETVDYARTQNVKIVIWLNTNEVFKPEDRSAYFAKAKAAGVVGLKIDFPPQGAVNVIDWYDDTLRDAAKLHLFVDFHGAVKPTGRDRTWPNELNREGIRGHEYHMTRYNRVQLPEHDTILPFTRYLAGHADYTPTAFVASELKGFTWPRELAQAVVFTAPFLCYADRPDRYLDNPACDVLEAIPAVWDETRVLPGSEIGKVVAFARRKGDVWFIGAMNGGSPSHLDIDLGFLDKPYQLVKVEDVPGRDDALNKTTSTVQPTDHLTLDLRAKGGFVGWLKPAP
jgi:alpha-glucosidase